MDAINGTGASEGIDPNTGAGQPGQAGAAARRIGSMWRTGAVAGIAVAATVVAGSAFGLAARGASFDSATSSTSTSPRIHNALQVGGYGSNAGRVSGSGFGGGLGGLDNGFGGYGGSGSGTGDSGTGSPSGSRPTSLGSATAAQEAGVVDVTSQLTYDGAESAGTGVVLTSDGEILTNNHVVEGATSISVTVVSTGATYPASVVGTDATDDIAVLQLSNASGLTAASPDTATPATVGEAVTGVGNAGGAGGTPSASPGTVTALDQTITTQAEQAVPSETLHGLIETDADIQPGDSGGPLFDAGNEVIGIDTAAEQGGSTTAGYAIPISAALGIAAEIEAGDASATVTIGYPAFLGVEVAPSTGYAASGDATGNATTPGAAIAGVIEGTPAAAAGLSGGDTITSLNGAAVASAGALTAALAGHRPGDQVGIGWTDASGAPHTATVTLARGPVA